MICDAFDLHRSTYNYRRRAAVRINPQKIKLNALVRSAHQASQGSAGARTIAGIVTEQAMPLSRYRAGRVMRHLGLISTQLPKHRYAKATQPHNMIDNVLDRQWERHDHRHRGSPPWDSDLRDRLPDLGLDVRTSTWLGVRPKHSIRSRIYVRVLCLSRNQ